MMSWCNLKTSVHTLISALSIDAEYPIDCDDEYWDHPDPALNFQQPVGKPSTMSHFICTLKLSAILSHALVGIV